MISKYIEAMLLTVCVSLSAACGRENAVYETAVSSETEAGTDGSQDETAGQGSDGAGLPGPQVIFVYVCGAVREPGVYELPAGSRVYEAVAAAGGMTEQADEKSLNQAGVLEDGQQITVYTAEEAATLPVQDGTGTSGGKVNLNTASRDALRTLPGIGEAKADAILAYRDEHGGFKSTEEIQQVEGIKEKVFEKIKDQIEV